METITYMISGYHGTSDANLAPYVGLCITDDILAAEHYADQNGGAEVLAFDIDTTNLVVVDVEYDYDGCEPILDGVEADVAEYLDCDEQGRTHRTWMLLTKAAVAATN